MGTGSFGEVVYEGRSDPVGCPVDGIGGVCLGGPGVGGRPQRRETKSSPPGSTSIARPCKGRGEGEAGSRPPGPETNRASQEHIGGREEG